MSEVSAVSDVCEINRIDALGDYRDRWSSLLAQTANASFFQSLQWLEVYWRHYGAGQKLRVLVVGAGGQITGIVPLVVRRERTRLGSVRVLTYPLHDWGSFYGPVGPEPEATLAEAMTYVRSSKRDWDILELRWVESNCMDGGSVQRAMRSAGLRCYETVWDNTAVVDLSESWASYFASRPAKWRNNLRRCQKRLNASGHLTFVHYRPLGEAAGDGSPRWDLYDACEQVAERSWQGGSTTGTTLNHASIRPFLRDAHQAAARAGAVDLHLMSLDGQPMAFAYNYHNQGRIAGLRAGFDAGLSREGAGTVLMARAIEESFRHGDRLYDLGVGSLECKRYLVTRLIPIYRYSHFPRAAFRGQLLRLKRSWQAKCLAKTSKTSELFETSEV